MSTSQESFEQNVLLESELRNYGGDDYQFNMDYSLDTAGSGCLTINQLMRDRDEVIQFDERAMLYAVVRTRLDLLSPLQRQIAQLKYIELKSYREIAKTLNKAIATIHFHIQKIKVILAMD